MELVWATQEFTVNGQPYLGFPILLYDSMESCVPANRFMRYYLLRGEIGSRRSWPSIGRAMYDYFSFLDTHSLKWDDIQCGEEQSLVRAYRDYCLDTIKLHRNTVRQRLIYICKFYEYGLKQKWINSLPFNYEVRTVRRHQGFLTHVDASGGKVFTRDVSPKTCRELPKFLSKDQIKALLAAPSNPHHKMMIRLGLQTGLRREEIASFPVAYIFDPDKVGNTERNIRIRLDPFDGQGIRTKGSVARDIYISRRFFKDLYHYVVHTRGLRASLSSVKNPQLFLNQRGEPYASDGKRIERIVREVGKRVDIKVYPHMLRHTYATHTLCAMQRSNTKLDPLIFVQQQLGHASVQTTLVYLHIIHEQANQAVLTYDDELNDWVEEG